MFGSRRPEACKRTPGDWRNFAKIPKNHSFHSFILVAARWQHPGRRVQWAGHPETPPLLNRVCSAPPGSYVAIFQHAPGVAVQCQVHPARLFHVLRTHSFCKVGAVLSQVVFPPGAWVSDPSLSSRSPRQYSASPAAVVPRPGVCL